MKRKDFCFAGGAVVLLLPFMCIPVLREWYHNFNTNHGMVISFLKFAVLATAGEMLGLRISAGVYNRKGFGIMPRALVWGVLGMGINMAMIIFSNGTPAFLEYLGMSNAREVMAGGLSLDKILVAFSISAAMNSIFAPVFMTLHKITDTHILQNGGTLRRFLRPIKMKEIFKGLNWGVQWSFVFKKTIPLFWIPAHTITFLLPGSVRVLFAAFLGVVLGVFLAIAARMGER
jgi:hypothetical protein